VTGQEEVPVWKVDRAGQKSAGAKGATNQHRKKEEEVKAGKFGNNSKGYRA